VPERSVTEALAWGATVALWSYTDIAASYGYASPGAFVAEFTAAGIPIQGTTNTSAVSDITGPFMQDAGGSDWKAGPAPDRPALNSGVQDPLGSRVALSISYMPANDPTNTQAPKLAAIAAQVSAGVFGLQIDDPRGPAAYSGWKGIDSGHDLTGQGCDFSVTARAGFTIWLGANTTSAVRTAVGLPANLSGFDILAWLKTNKASIMFGANQVSPTDVDNYLYRTSVSQDSSLRTIILQWMGQYLRDDNYSFLRQIRTQLAGAPFSLNLFNACPSEILSGIARQSPQIFDFAIAETQSPWWEDLSGYTVGSAQFFTVRAAQQALQKFNASVCDMAGLHAFFVHRPTSLTGAPARVVKQMLRQALLQTIADGHSPVIPVDVFMSSGGTKSQGVDVDGYRFWGSRADYKDVFDFILYVAPLIDNYEKLAAVHVVVHGDSFPFYDGAQGPIFNTIMSRMSELWKRDVDYHLMSVGASDGMLPQDPVRTVELAAPIIIRLQDDCDYYTHLGRLAGPKFRRWSTKAADEAMGHSSVRSTNPYVRATARYSAGRVSVHLQNFAINSDGTPNPQTTTLLWNWGKAGSASVTRIGESATSIDLSSGHADVSLAEYAVVNFAVF
jgi:hypothetical protein